MNSAEIMKYLPYGKDFLFIDNILYVNEEMIIGEYTFRENSFFYNSHFKHLNIVPGTLIIESMGQIGMVAHIIYLLELTHNHLTPLLSYVNVDFYNPLYFGQKCIVKGNKKYFRESIFKSEVTLHVEDLIIARLTANLSTKSL